MIKSVFGDPTTGTEVYSYTLKKNESSILLTF